MPTVLTTPTALQRAVQFAAAAQLPHLPAFAWSAAGRGALVMIPSAPARWPKKEIAQFGNRPILIVVGADVGEDRDPDPDQWRCAPELRRWTRAAMIHASGGEADHYRMACSVAERVGRCVIVECTPRTAERWVELLACPRSFVIWPREGMHPSAPAREAMQ